MPTPQSKTLARGRAAFARQAWGEAFTHLSAADRVTPLEPDDLRRVAYAAHLLGKATESADYLARTHQAYLAAGNAELAARAAFWLGFELLNRGDLAQGSGWLGRARRVLDEGKRDCVERGYLLIPEGIRAIHDGAAAAAATAFQRAATIGARYHDRDLVTMALVGEGRALLRQGDTARGLGLLDEAMVAVISGEVSPAVVGGMFCSLLDACHELFDLRRAHEWTAALTAWCAAQPEVVLYRGQCLVRRAELMRLHGEWKDALDETVRAREVLSKPPGQQGLGTAIYQHAELHRLQGRFAEAETEYGAASRHGRTPQPGLALLRLAQGQLESATAGIRRALDETRERRPRTLVLAAAVEVSLAAGDRTGARAAADDLAAIATQLAVPYVRALAAQANGAVLLAEGEPQAALPALRGACIAWSDLEAPYETARARALIALAARKLGDLDTADLEWSAARDVFQRLGAKPDVAALTPAAAGVLTAREVEVLRLVASGKTNRGIAAALGISDKTVARHVSNIFTKIGASSRTAAAAYAYEHELMRAATK